MTAEFRLNLIPVIAFLTPSPLAYVPEALFPALECYFLWESTEQKHSGCHIDSDENAQ